MKKKSSPPLVFIVIILAIGIFLYKSPILHNNNLTKSNSNPKTLTTNFDANNHNFTLQYPSDWKVGPTTSNTRDIVVLLSSDYNASPDFKTFKGAQIIEDTVDAGMGTSLNTEVSQAELQAGSKPDEETPITIDGFKAKKLVYQNIKSPFAMEEILYEWHNSISNKTGVSKFDLLSNKQNFETNRIIFEKIIASLKFTN